MCETAGPPRASRAAEAFNPVVTRSPLRQDKKKTKKKHLNKAHGLTDLLSLIWVACSGGMVGVGGDERQKEGDDDAAPLVFP